MKNVPVVTNPAVFREGDEAKHIETSGALGQSLPCFLYLDALLNCHIWTIYTYDII